MSRNTKQSLFIIGSPVAEDHKAEYRLVTGPATITLFPQTVSYYRQPK